MLAFSFYTNYKSSKKLSEIQRWGVYVSVRACVGERACVCVCIATTFTLISLVLFTMLVIVLQY